MINKHPWWLKKINKKLKHEMKKYDNHQLNKWRAKRRFKGSKWTLTTTFNTTTKTSIFSIFN